MPGRYGYPSTGHSHGVRVWVTHYSWANKIYRMAFSRYLTPSFLTLAYQRACFGYYLSFRLTDCYIEAFHGLCYNINRLGISFLTRFPTSWAMLSSPPAGTTLGVRDVRPLIRCLKPSLFGFPLSSALSQPSSLWYVFRPLVSYIVVCFFLCVVCFVFFFVVF